MKTIALCSSSEHIRDIFKTALADHVNLIVTEDREQFIEAITQKAAIHKAFVDIADENDGTDPEIFVTASELKPQLSLIAVGTQETHDDAVKAVRHGATGYIIVPVKAQEILTMAR
jgi:DNA-binding NtrC family response regulator